MDAFYASVEQRDFPELRGKPIAVGGSGGRGVVSTCSYEAREFGVRSAMPGVVALRKCPTLIFVPPRFDAYQVASKKIREIFERYTALIEPLSLDEAFLDVTNPRVDIPSPVRPAIGGATAIALEIKEKIKEELNLTASAGVSYCKFLAKIASDMNKPDGCTLIRPERAQAVLDSLPIEKFFGIGAKTAEQMKRSGIHVGADLKTWNKKALENRFGKSGGYYYNIVRGIDDRPVQANRLRKSISIEDTFTKDVDDSEQLHAKFLELRDGLWKRMRKSGFYGRTLTLKVKYFDFKQQTKSMSIAEAMDNELKLKNLAEKLFAEVLAKPMKPVRLIGLGNSSQVIDKGDDLQLPLDF